MIKPYVYSSAHFYAAARLIFCAKEYSDARLEFSPRAKMKEQEEACVFIVLSLFFVAFQSKIRENI